MPFQSGQQIFRVVKPETRAKQARRRHRRPRHPFNLKTKPFQIAPFLIAPVLPGETLDNALLQARVITDPINHPLIGWWKEYYFFYVKHRSLMTTEFNYSSTLQSMMLSTTTDVSALKASANSVPFFTFKGGVRFVEAAYAAIVETFFRDEGVEWDTYLIDSYAAAYMDQGNIFQSLKSEASGTDDSELPGVDLLEEAAGNILTGYTTNYDQWELMRDNGLTDLTYEDYLRSNGVDVPKAQDEGDEGEIDTRHLPELLRYTRQWQYPSNHVDPATGIPTSAVSWSIAERLNKRRYFREPGFIFGVTVTRPKVYMGTQKGSASGMLDHAFKWSPGVLKDHPYISVTEVPNSATDGILQGNPGVDVWLDLADLLEHGEPFWNHAVTVANAHGFTQPTGGGAHRALSESEVDDLFVTPGTAEEIREDGLVSFDILTKKYREETL